MVGSEKNGQRILCRGHAMAPTTGPMKDPDPLSLANRHGALQQAHQVDPEIRRTDGTSDE